MTQKLLPLLALVLCQCGSAKDAATQSVTLVASPESAAQNGTSTLAWESQGFSTCTLESTQPPNFTDTVKTSGQQKVTLGQISTVYLLTCSVTPASKGAKVPAPMTATAYVAVH